MCLSSTYQSFHCMMIRAIHGSKDRSQSMQVNSSRATLPWRHVHSSSTFFILPINLSDVGTSVACSRSPYSITSRAHLHIHTHTHPTSDYTSRLRCKHLPAVVSVSLATQPPKRFQEIIPCHDQPAYHISQSQSSHELSNRLP